LDCRGGTVLGRGDNSRCGVFSASVRKCASTQSRSVEHIISEALGNIEHIPIIGEIDERLMSRFLAKVAIEILAHRLMGIEGWEEPLVDDPQLDALRRFARVGDEPKSWPFSHRRLYGQDDLHVEGGYRYQILHEFDLLYTESHELYAVLCIFGEEFAINFSDPDIEGYQNWLKGHDGQSPLYLKK
jgi:hypothetical protein